MATRVIDKRTQRSLDECLKVDRPVAALAYDYAVNDHIPAHEHPKAQLIYAIEGTMTVITREGRWILLPTPSGMGSRKDAALHSCPKCSAYANAFLRQNSDSSGERLCRCGGLHALCGNSF